MNDLNNFINNNRAEILEVHSFINSESPGSKKYQIFLNHLLMKIYTSYECYVKDIIINTFQSINHSHVYTPVLSTVRITNSTWTPNLSKESLEKFFPLLKNWDFWIENEYKFTNTLIIERHRYAHTGVHTLTYEQLLISFLEISYIIKFISLIYNHDNKQVSEFPQILELKYNNLQKIETHKRTYTNLKSSSEKQIPIHLNTIFSNIANSIDDFYILVQNIESDLLSFLNISKSESRSTNLSSINDFCEFFNEFENNNRYNYPNFQSSSYQQLINLYNLIKDNTFI